MSDSSNLGDSRLAAWLAGRIEASERKAIPFISFMEACLYHPLYGYYMREQEKIGRDGDFYTSASLGTIMGEMLAAFFAGHFERYLSEDVCAVVEWGAGNGKLAADIADELKKTAPHVYRKLRYTLIDASPHHRRMLRLLAERHPGVFTVAAPEEAGSGSLPRGAVVFCNELLDAFPVHRLVVKDGRFQEVYVAWDGRGFVPMLVPDVPDEVAAYLREYAGEAAEGQTVEANLAADAWIREIAGRIGEGMLMIIDYGGLAEEIYAPHHHDGTLMCYHRHIAHGDPYRHVGRQDITAHVNFSACIKSGLSAGFTSWSLKSQRRFLIDAGLLDRLEAHASTDPFHPAARRNRAIRQMLIDDGMGELFKVLTLVK